MNQYIITEEDLCTIRDYILGAFYEGENKEKMYDHIKAEFSVIRSHPYQSERDKLHLSSSDLLLIAHDEWKRREERKNIHEHISWVNGWISGFLTSRKFVQEKVAELRQAGEQ